MNIETANKLVQLRKKNNLSQEELANKLSVSRQAVSKWERAEAAPDTDNLIKLARLYKISLDELLLSDNEFLNEIDKEIENSKPSDDLDGIRIKKDDKEIIIGSDRMQIIGRNGEKSNYDKSIYYFKRTSLAIISSLCIIGFFLYGFITEKWYVAWLFFLGIPLISSIVIAIRFKKIKYFNYPTFVTIIFFLLGFIYGIWTDAWIVFLTIPLFYLLFGGPRRVIYINKK